MSPAPEMEVERLFCLFLEEHVKLNVEGGG